MKQTIRKLARVGRDREMIWRYGFNLKSLLDYKLNPSSELGEAERGVLKDLNENGVAMISLSRLLENENLLNEFESSVTTLLADWEDKLREMELAANDVNAIGEKSFNVELLGKVPDFNPDSVFARLALEEKLLNIANAYFGMCAKLRYYNVWHTFVTQTASRESQLWHYDREDNYILKIFVYLKDVGEGTGPFTYAPKTHRKGALWARQPESFLEGGVPRSTDEQMAEVVPREDWIKATGSKWTIIFADTRGYHKGGEAKTDERLMYTCMFTSQASQSKKLLKFPDGASFAQLNKKQLSAVEPF